LGATKLQSAPGADNARYAAAYSKSRCVYIYLKNSRIPDDHSDPFRNGRA